MAATAGGHGDVAKGKLPTYGNGMDATPGRQRLGRDGAAIDGDIRRQTVQSANMIHMVMAQQHRINIGGYRPRRFIWLQRAARIQQDALARRTQQNRGRGFAV
jgi:hypothetical protein